MGTINQTVAHAESEDLRIQTRKTRPEKTDPWEEEAEELSAWLARRKEGETAAAPPITPVRPNAPWGSEISRQTAAGIQSHPGKPLDPELRRDFESALQTDLGDVRIHDDPAARRLVRSLGAKAFAAGQNIFTTSHHRTLLAHEVVHTVQQKDGPAKDFDTNRAQCSFEDPTNEIDPKLTILLEKHLKTHGAPYSDVADALIAEGSWFKTLRASLEIQNENDTPPTFSVTDVLDTVLEGIATYESDDPSTDPDIEDRPLLNAVAAVMADYFRMNGAHEVSARIILHYPRSKTLVRSTQTREVLEQLTDAEEQNKLARNMQFAVKASWELGRGNKAFDWADEIANVVDDFMGTAPTDDNLPQLQQYIDRIQEDIPDTEASTYLGERHLGGITNEKEPVPNELSGIANHLLNEIRGETGAWMRSARDYDTRSPWVHWRYLARRMDDYVRQIYPTEPPRDDPDEAAPASSRLSGTLRRNAADTSRSDRNQAKNRISARALPILENRLKDRLKPKVNARLAFWERIRRIGTGQTTAELDPGFAERIAAGGGSVRAAFHSEDDASLTLELAPVASTLATALRAWLRLTPATTTPETLTVVSTPETEEESEEPAPEETPEPEGNQHYLMPWFENHHQHAESFRDAINDNLLPQVLALLQTALAADDQDAADRYAYFGRILYITAHRLDYLATNPVGGDLVKLAEHVKYREELVNRFDNISGHTLAQFEAEGAAPPVGSSPRIRTARDAWRNVMRETRKAKRLEYIGTSVLVLPHPFEEIPNTAISDLDDRDEGEDSVVISGIEPFTEADLVIFYQRDYFQILRSHLWFINDTAREAGVANRTLEDLWLSQEAVERVDREFPLIRPIKYVSRDIYWKQHPDEPARRFGDLLPEDPRYLAWREAREQEFGESYGDHYSWTPLMPVNGPNENNTIVVWVLPSPAELFRRFDNNPFFLKLGALSPERWSEVMTAMTAAANAAVGALPDEHREDEEREARRNGTEASYNALVEEIRNAPEFNPANDEQRGNIWIRAMNRVEQLSNISRRSIMRETEIFGDRGRVLGEERGERRQARINLDWELRRATTLDRKLIAHEMREQLTEASEENAVVRIGAVGNTLRMIGFFERSVQPRHEDGTREQRLQTSALILQLVGPFTRMLRRHFSSTGQYNNRAHILLKRAKNDIPTLLREEEALPSPLPSTDTSVRGILYSTDRYRDEELSPRVDYWTGEIDAALEYLTEGLREKQWKYSIAADKDERLIYSHSMGGNWDVKIAPRVDEENQGKDPEDQERPYIAIGQNMRVRINRIYNSFTYIPGFGDRGSARDPETTNEARYLKGKVFLDLVATDEDEVYEDDPTAIATEEPSASPPIAEGSQRIKLVEVEVLPRNEEEQPVTFDIYSDEFADDLENRRGGLNWLTAIVHHEAHRQAGEDAAAIADFVATVVLTTASLYPPANAVITAVEVLQFIDEMNSPEVQEQLQALINDPMDTVVHFVEAMMEHFTVDGLFRLALVGHFDAPAFAARSPGRSRRRVGGSAVRRVLTRMGRLAGAVAVRLEAYQEAAQSPIRRVQQEMGEHPRLSAIVNWMGEHADDLTDPVGLLLQHPIAGPVYEAYAAYRERGEDSGGFASIQNPIQSMATGIQSGIERMQNFELPRTIMPIRHMAAAAVDLTLMILRRSGRRARLVGTIGELVEGVADSTGASDFIYEGVESWLSGTWADPNTYWVEFVVPQLNDPIRDTINQTVLQINDLLINAPLLGDYFGEDSFSGRSRQVSTANSANGPDVVPTGNGATASADHDDIFENNERVAGWFPEVDTDEGPDLSGRLVAPLPRGYYESLERTRNLPANGESESEEIPPVSPQLSDSPPPPPGTARGTSSGSQLPPTLRRSAERRFGHGFSDVRLHRGLDAENMTTRLGADALTAGNHIFFRTDLDPGSGRGSRILDHELAHVLQTRGTRSPGATHGLRYRADEERAADRMAERARNNREGAPLAIEGAHDFGASPSVGSDLMETFFENLSSPSGITAFSDTVTRAHGRSVADIHDDNKAAAMAIWRSVAEHIEGTPSTTNQYRGARDLIKDHLINRLGNVGASGGGTLPTINPIIPHLAERREGDPPSSSSGSASGSGSGSSSGNQVVPPFDISGFINDLSLYILGRSGVSLDIRVTNQRNIVRLAKNNSNYAPRSTVQVKHLELVLASHLSDPGKALWNHVVGKTWESDVDIDDHKTALRQVLEREFGGPAPESAHDTAPAADRQNLPDTVPGEGSFMQIWDTSARDTKLNDEYKEKVNVQLNPATLDYNLMPKADYYANPERTLTGNYDNETQTRQVAVHWRNKMHGDLTDGSFNLQANSRNSHHLIQYILPEYFNNKKDFQPFPKLNNSRKYPGVENTNELVETIKDIKVKETESGRGSKMPAILLSAHAHQNSGLHVDPHKLDPAISPPGSPDKNPSQGYAIHRIFRTHLEQQVQTRVGETLEGNPLDDRLIELRREGNSSAETAVYEAVRQTYRWLHGENSENLTGTGTDKMPNKEANFYADQFGGSDDAKERFNTLNNLDYNTQRSELVGTLAEEVSDQADAAMRSAVDTLRDELGWTLPS